MVDANEASFHCDGADLRLRAALVPWDSAVFEKPVAAIEAIEIGDERAALQEFAAFERWRDAQGVHLVSCRLDHAKLRESMLLEARGFRFIEMVMHPRLDDLRVRTYDEDEVIALPAEKADLPALCAIAEHAFHHERYYVDPRVERRITGERYRRWVVSAFGHARQRLVKCVRADDIVAMFIVEQTEPAAVYWHLVAVAPEWQGQGYGRRSFRAMLKQHADAGIRAVSTTTSARNVAMQNLCASEGFRVLPPEMTFHWVRG